jgi:hypothetical protein
MKYGATKRDTYTIQIYASLYPYQRQALDAGTVRFPLWITQARHYSLGGSF